MTRADAGLGQDNGKPGGETEETRVRENTYWYKTIVLGVGLASTAALAVALRPLISNEVTAKPGEREADIWLLAASKRTSFEEIGSWFNASTDEMSLALGIMQLATVLILTLSGTIFVWRNAKIFAKRASSGKALLEIAIFACIIVCCSISTSTVWGFRIFGAAAGLAWFTRAAWGYYLEPKAGPEERHLFRDPMRVYRIYVIVVVLFLVLGGGWLIRGEWSDIWLLVDIAVTIVPFVGAVVWTFFLNLILGKSVSAAISNRVRGLFD